MATPVTYVISEPFPWLLLNRLREQCLALYVYFRKLLLKKQKNCLSRELLTLIIIIIIILIVHLFIVEKKVSHN